MDIETETQTPTETQQPNSGIIHFDGFDLNNIDIDTTSVSKTNEKGIKYVNLRLQSSVNLQLPELLSKFGIENNKLDVSCDDNPSVVQFANNLDRRIVSLLFNYRESLGIDADSEQEIMDMMYHPCIMSNEKYGSRIRIKVSSEKTSSIRPSSQFWSLKQNEETGQIEQVQVKQEAVTPRSRLKTIFSFGSIWIKQNKEMGLTLFLTGALITAQGGSGNVTRTFDMIGYTSAPTNLRAYNEYDFTQMKFSETPSVSSVGQSMIWADNSHRFQLPPCRVPYGLDAGGSYQESTGTFIRNDVFAEDARLSLSLSIEDENLLLFLQNLEGYVVQQGAKNSKSWFNKKLTEKQIRKHKLSSLMKVKEPYSPTLKTKIKRSGPNQVKVYNPSGEEISIYEIAKGSTIVPVLKLGWLTSVPAFRITMIVTDILVLPSSSASNSSVPFNGKFL